MARRSSGPGRGGRPSASAIAAILQDVVAGWQAAQAFKAPRPAAVPKAKEGPKRRAEPARRPVRTQRPAPGGRIEALGWLLAAGVILALPRETSPFDWAFLRRRVDPPTPTGEVAAAEALEPGRGRAARHPGQIPLAGWRDILWRTWREFNRDNIPQVAGGVAFFGLLAVFPAMAAFVSLYGLFFDPVDMQRHIALLSGLLPEAALGLVQDQLYRLSHAPNTGLGLAFVASLLVSLWSANAGMKAMIVGLNVAFEEKEKRSLLKLNLVSLGFTVAALAFTLLAVAAIVAAPMVLAYAGYKAAQLAVLRWPCLLLGAVIGLSALYRFGPSRRLEKWKWLSWGSGLAALLWLAASLLFSVYVAHFGTYNRTYGSLGAVVGFMSWIWISSIAVLVGAEINSEIEHQTAVDTTVGPAALMGARGAHMADTLGATRHGRRKAASAARPRDAEQGNTA